MADRRFPIFGTCIPPMLGRTEIMQRLWNNLTKATPSNLSIIGPRFAGKTVIMNALAQRATCEGSPYKFVLHWHLGHIAPVSDGEFVTQLCDLLRDKLAAYDSDYAEYKEYLGGHSFDFLKEVTDWLHSDGKAILMLWDGFDKPLGQGKLSGHLWDQMRTLFYGKRHKIVTATRAPLRELISREDAITSPFWNIFDMSPIRVGAFDDTDCDLICGELANLTFQPGAKTELMNWSSGFPPIFLAVLNHIADKKTNGSIDNEEVNHSAAAVMASLVDVISELWEDCPAEAKDVYYHLIEHGGQPHSDVGKNEQDCLIQKGFARLAGNKIIPSCRMLQEYAQNGKRDAGSMARLFGTWADYQANIRSILERRLFQISPFDERLYHLVANAIKDIPKYPDDCLNNLTNIEERALDLIWQREFGLAKTIPQEIIDYWYQANSTDRTVQRLKEQAGSPIPGDRTFQCRVLQLLTGSQGGCDCRAKYISKNTYVLINAIHSFRNRGQHSDGQEIYVGVAVTALMACLELLSCLDREVGEL